MALPTKLSDFSGFLSAEEAEPIFDEAARQSVVQQLVRRIPLGVSGQNIPYVTTKPVANWVAEGDVKPTTEIAMNVANMAPKKLAAITVLSAEVVRANPGQVTDQLRQGLADAFAVAFDYAALHGVGGDGTGSGPFTADIADTSKTIALGTAAANAGGIHTDLVNGMKLLVNDGKRLTGFALDDVVEPHLWGAVDTAGHPLYVDLPTDSVSQAAARAGRLLNRPSYMGPGVSLGTTVAFGGDWTKAAWGAIGGISYRVSTEAAVTLSGNLVSMFEKNLVAIVAEAEYGFVVADTAAFVKFTDATQSASA